MSEKHKKIGIMTFHWAPNYGAVIQAYSLGYYLESRYGYEVEMIDYYPDRLGNTLKRAMRPSYPSVMWNRFKEYIRDRKIEPFRKMYLKRSRRYHSSEQLKKEATGYDILICGSDQIWNQSFTLYGEDRFTTAYYLDFGGNCKRIAYAASFGCVEYPPELLERIAPLLRRFDRISVRENSGKKIVEAIPGCSATVVADPTVLPERGFFLNLVKNEKEKKQIIGIYVLRNKDDSVMNFANRYRLRLDRAVDVVRIRPGQTMEEWLNTVRSSEIFITNSFHGMMMCIRFHVKFAVVLEIGKLNGMNDRFYTILEQLDLRNCIISGNSKEEVQKFVEMRIDWEQVESKLAEIRSAAEDFIEEGVTE